MHPLPSDEGTFIVEFDGLLLLQDMWFVWGFAVLAGDERVLRWAVVVMSRSMEERCDDLYSSQINPAQISILR